VDSPPALRNSAQRWASSFLPILKENSGFRAFLELCRLVSLLVWSYLNLGARHSVAIFRVVEMARESDTFSPEVPMEIPNNSSIV